MKCKDCNKDLTGEIQYYERDTDGRLQAVRCEECWWADVKLEDNN